LTREQLFQNIQKKKSFLCIGLDPDPNKIPKHLLAFDDPVFEFNRLIIDATHHTCIAYKPNLAFYECLGIKGWQALEKTINYINKNYPDHFTIADAKRGDIGNTSKMYAQAFFEKLNFDAVTVSPYMGEDSVKPFLEYENKWVILLALTSNPGAEDFQKLFIKERAQDISHKDESVSTTFDSRLTTYDCLYGHVLQTSQQWGTPDNMMYVIGATQASQLSDIRKIIPHHFLLIPGVGAQGGSLQEVAKHGMNKQCGMLVNSSRNIIYAGNDEHFEKRARTEAEKIQSEMGELLNPKSK
jgi:orotidine-5'-phosphate decarboxylase